MGIFALTADERVRYVHFTEDTLSIGVVPPPSNSSIS